MKQPITITFFKLFNSFRKGLDSYTCNHIGMKLFYFRCAILAHLFLKGVSIKRYLSNGSCIVYFQFSNNRMILGCIFFFRLIFIVLIISHGHSQKLSTFLLT